MSEAWIGVIGALVGALVGAGIAALISLREQQREPRLKVLEKRINAHSRIYGRLFTLAECLHRDENKQTRIAAISQFKTTFISNTFYLDDESRKKVAAVHNFLVKALDENQLDLGQFDTLTRDAMTQLFDILNRLKYT